MSFLIQGAAAGLLGYGSLGMLCEQTRAEIRVSNVAKWALTGLITGAAIAAIASFAGSSAAIGAGLCAIPLSLSTDLSCIKNTTLMATVTVFGASVGYVLGLVNWPAFLIIIS